MTRDLRADARSPAPPSRHPPRPPASLVPRSRLTRLLDHPVALTFVVAPAGSGKTVLAAEWVQARRATGEETLWVPATDAGTLLPALATAVSAPQHGTRVDPVAPVDADPADVVRALASARPVLPAPPVPIVIDDAHQLPPDSIAVLARVLTAAPELVRFVLLTRRDLPLPLVPLDLADQLVMIRAGQLCFDDGEAAELVRSHAPRATPDDVAQLQEHTRGWAAALVLAARTLDAADDPRTAHLMMRSTAQPVLDYLLGESLDGLSADTRDVLVSVCHETEVTAESAITLSARADAAERLTALARHGLLVTAYADRPGGDLVWRLHPLLLEALRRQAAHDAGRSASDAHVRGAVLARAAGHPDDALRHAVLSGEEELLADLLLDLGPELLAAGQVQLVDDGLRHVSQAFRSVHPQLLGIEALCRVQAGDVADALDLGARAEAALAGLAVPLGESRADRADAVDLRFRADVARLRLWRARMGWGELGSAITAATAVLESPAQAPLPVARAGTTMLELGAAEAWHGDLDHALRHTRAALAAAHSSGYDMLMVEALGQCALLDAARGATQSARSAAVECLRLARDGDLGTSLARDLSARRCQVALAWAAFEALELGEAATHLELSAPTEQPTDPLVVAMAGVLRARLLIEEGRLQEAERVLAVPPSAPSPLPRSVLALTGSARAQIAAATGDDDGLELEIATLLELGCIAEARLYSAIRTAFEGRVSEAVADLDDLAGTPCPSLITRSAVETVRLSLLLLSGDLVTGRAAVPHVLTTIATHRHLQVLTAALRVGEVFLDCLRHEARRPDAHPYAAEALAAMRSYELSYTDRRRPLLHASRTGGTAGRRGTDNLPPRVAGVVSDLTPREVEVFEQLALGGSYGDIGRALFVTENTVKTHLASIYRKLGVERRAEALRVGRERGLLDVAPQRRRGQ